MDDGEEQKICFIEGTNIDKTAAADISDLHENVWFRLKPPKRSNVMYEPSVSARQIDLIRNMLLGRTPIKVSEIKAECFHRENICELPARRDVIEKPCLRLKKSSVKFLNQSAYD